MTVAYSTLAQFVSMPGGGELLIIAIIGLLLFGKRLPEVGRSLGKGIVEFKKGLRGIEDQLEDAVTRPPQDHSSTEYTSPVTDTYETPAATEYHPAEASAQTHETPATTEPHATEPPAQTHEASPVAGYYPTDATTEKPQVPAGH